MDQVRRQELLAGGIDVDGALERFMGSEALLERFLGKFLQDTNYAALEQAVARGDWEEALRASHTLKGVCGNLSMTGLYDLFTRQVAAIRGGALEEAAALMEEIAPARAAVLRAISGAGKP